VFSHQCTTVRYSGNVKREGSLFKYKQRVNLQFHYIRRTCVVDILDRVLWRENSRSADRIGPTY